MDEKELLAALALVKARRRSSVITLIVVNGLLALGLGVFFGAPLLRCEPAFDPPAPLPVDPRDLPFAPTTELALVPDAGKIIGINFRDRGFYIAPRGDGSGWYYFNLAAPWEVAPAYRDRLLQRLAHLPAAEIAEVYSPTPFAVKITLSGTDDLDLNLGEMPPEPDTRPVFLRIPGRPLHLISAADARLLYPISETVLGPTPKPIERPTPKPIERPTPDRSPTP
jgi:hypothetical protein